jgi:hypothetical protein
VGNRRAPARGVIGLWDEGEKWGGSGVVAGKEGGGWR